MIDWGKKTKQSLCQHICERKSVVIYNSTTLVYLCRMYAEYRVEYTDIDASACVVELDDIFNLLKALTKAIDE